MTDLGFHDWSEEIDRSYEAELSPAKRFRMLLDEVMRQKRNIRSDPGAWIGRTREIGAYNIRHAAGGALLANYCENFDKPVVARLAALVGGRGSTE